MCTVVTFNPYALPLLLAAFALTISTISEGIPTSEAFPVMKQERSVDVNPFQGDDLPPVLLDSTIANDKYSKSTYEPQHFSRRTTEHRIARSTYHEEFKRIRPTVGSLFKINRPENVSTENTSGEGRVVAVRVSSSIGKTLINKNSFQVNLEQGKNGIDDFGISSEKPETIRSTTTEEVTQSISAHQTDRNQITEADQLSLASEVRPSLIAEANKHELHIEEKEPITTDTEPRSSSPYERSFQRPILPDFNPPTDLIRNAQSQTKLHPYQQTVIFHDTGDSQARSVSYSSVSQGVPNLGEKNWYGENIRNHERQERHYDGTKSSDFINNFNTDDKAKLNRTDFDLHTSNSYQATEHPRNLWDITQIATSSTPKFDNEDWKKPAEKPYIQRPLSRPQPEQNYEIDESVSVVTNGRVHGVQPKTNDSKNKKDDNQKVGYVVEGRNYRKYRVEERTSDGFIVGEYGVVSHDDGSLRGVRYTADGTINPRLIYDALMKFLSL